MASLLTGRRLGVRVVGIGLVGFVMADDATGRCAELAMASHVPGDAADNGALNATLGLRRREGGECQQANGGENCFHGCSPKSRGSNVSSLGRWASSVPQRSDVPNREKYAIQRHFSGMGTATLAPGAGWSPATCYSVIG